MYISLYIYVYVYICVYHHATSHHAEDLAVVAKSQFPLKAPRVDVCATYICTLRKRSTPSSSLALQRQTTN